jgi:hypothetical protein
VYALQRSASVPLPASGSGALSPLGGAANRAARFGDVAESGGDGGGEDGGERWTDGEIGGRAGCAADSFGLSTVERCAGGREVT